MIPPHQLPPDIGHAVASYKVREENGVVTRDVRLWNKVEALDKIGRHFGMLNDRMNVRVQIWLEERFRAARHRLEQLASES